MRETKLSIALTAVALGLVAFAQSSAVAQAPPPVPGSAPAQNPICARLEGQLGALDRTAGDAPRLEQIKKLEEAANKQQYELDQLVAQSHRVGCQGSGFFVFGGQPPQCQQINAQVQQSRANLDRTLADMERLQHAGSERDGQRRGLIAALAQNNCGPQYRTQVASQPRNFFERLFGGVPPLFGNSPEAPPTDGTILPLPDVSPSSTFRTLCVRSCDGYYFPISYSATQARFAEDEKVCQRTCPAAEVSLYVHRNPGEDVNQAVSLSGKPYTELATAFQYRKEFVASCGCRRPGESWAQALRGTDNRGTIETGDILVDDQRAKLMSLPKLDAQGRPIKVDPRTLKVEQKPATEQSSATPVVEGSETPDPKRKVRSVGPPFLPGR